MLWLSIFIGYHHMPKTTDICRCTTEKHVPGRIRLGNRQRTYFSVLPFSFDWSRLPSSYMTAVTLSWPIRNDRLHRGHHCILVTWYTINGKYRYILYFNKFILRITRNWSSCRVRYQWAYSAVQCCQSCPTARMSLPTTKPSQATRIIYYCDGLWGPMW